MSKLGKKPIQIPKDTKVKFESGKLIMSGPKGSREMNINDKIFSTSLNENNLVINLINKNDKNKILWGTTRSKVNSAIIGVTTGHEKVLELSGVGFRANLKGNLINLQLGFSHDVSYEFPTSVKVVVEKSVVIKISGIDKEIVGKVASEIKKLKPVEPYKAKGIKERGQYGIRKGGKKK